jgi:hypothetical protein
MRRMGTIAINPLMNIAHQVTRRMSPTIMTMTPIMIPNTLNTLITSFLRIYSPPAALLTPA